MPFAMLRSTMISDSFVVGKRYEYRLVRAEVGNREDSNFFHDELAPETVERHSRSNRDLRVTVTRDGQSFHDAPRVQPEIVQKPGVPMVGLFGLEVGFVQKFA